MPLLDENLITMTVPSPKNFPANGSNLTFDRIGPKYFCLFVWSVDVANLHMENNTYCTRTASIRHKIESVWLTGVCSTLADVSPSGIDML